jgi:AraC-like DNA-binding protein
MELQKIRFRRVPAPDSPLGIHVGFEDFHRLRMTSHYEYPLHRHDGYEAIVVEAGTYRCLLNGEDLRIQRGQTLLVKPGDRHQDHLCKGQRHAVLHFRLTNPQGGPVPALFASQVSPHHQISQGPVTGDINLIDEIQHESTEGRPYGAKVQDGLMSALFWRWVRFLPVAALSPEYRSFPIDEARREEITDLFNRHLEQHESLPALAAELNVSPRQLTNQCRKLFGASPARLLLGMKVSRAVAMLRYQRMRVSEVSEALGFANPYHFSRAFRRTLGYPPSDIVHHRNG